MNMISKIKVAIVSLVLMAGVGSAFAVPGSGNKGTKVSQSYTVSDFKEVEASFGVKVNYRVSGSVSCRATGPEEAVERLQVIVKNGTIRFTDKVKHDQGVKGWRIVQGDEDSSPLKDVVVELTGPSKLKEIDVSLGAVFSCVSSMHTGRDMELEASVGGVINFGTLVVDDLEVSCSTGAVVNITDLTASEVELDFSTGAVANVGGSASEAKLSGSTGAVINAKGLKADGGNASASTGAEVNCAISNASVSSSTGGHVNNRP